MRRYVVSLLLLVGVVLVAGAGVVRWVVAPAVTVLPSDTNTTRVYTGMAHSLFNPTALTGTLFGPAMLHNVPATVTHTVRVLDTKGTNALVADRRTVNVPGFRVADFVDKYAVNRKTMAHGSGFNGVVNQAGVTFNWPIGTGKHDYVGWVADSRTTTPLHYAGTATRGGISTYMFTDSVRTTRIVDAAELAALPAAVPKSMLTTMVGTLGLNRSQLGQLATMLPKLPDPVPFAYTIADTSRYWVAPASGVVIDVQKHEVRTANVVLNGQLVPVAPVLDLTYAAPASTVAAAASDAKDKARQMTLIHSTLPLAALLTGAAFLVAGVAMIAGRRRTPARPSAPMPQPRELTRTG